MSHENTASPRSMSRAVASPKPFSAATRIALRTARRSTSRQPCAALTVDVAVRGFAKKARKATTAQSGMPSSCRKGKQSAVNSFLSSNVTTDNEKYSRSRKNLARQLSHHSYKSAFTGSQRPICESGATVGVRGFSENGCTVRTQYYLPTLERRLRSSMGLDNRPLWP